MTCTCWECENGSEFSFDDDGKTLIVGDCLYTITKAMREGAKDCINLVPWSLGAGRPDSVQRHDWEAGHELASCPEIAWRLAGLKHRARYKAGDQVLVLRSWTPNKVWVEGSVSRAYVKGGKWVYLVSAEIDLVRSTRTVSAWRLQPRDPVTKMGDLVR